jgi:glycosyltransferase involved in cell wall biosynthesis
MSDTPLPHIALAITLAKPGGTTSLVFSYASWLKKRGFKVTLLAGEGTWLFEEAAKVGIPCLRVPWMQREIRPWFDLPAIFSLARLLRTLKPDVVHLNSSKMGVIGSLSARLAGVPRVVYCIGGWAFLESIAPWKRRVYILAERFTARLKDVIVCLHPGDKQIAEEHGIRPREEIRVIPNGVDLQALDHARLNRIDARQALGLPQDRFVFGTIANFYPAKNLPTYIRTVGPLLKKSPSASLVLIGEGPERPQVEQAIRDTQISEQIVLTGAREQAHTFLAAFDVFVLPSTKEGMPLSLLEAMAARLPCITTRVGAHAWMLEGTGSSLLSPHDPEALRQALSEALQQRGRFIEVGEANRNIVERRFPLEKTFEAQLHACLPR